MSLVFRTALLAVLFDPRSNHPDGDPDNEGPPLPDDGPKDQPENLYAEAMSSPSNR